MPPPDYPIVDAARRLREVVLTTELPRHSALKAALFDLLDALARYERLDQPQDKRRRRPGESL